MGGREAGRWRRERGAVSSELAGTYGTSRGAGSAWPCVGRPPSTPCMAAWGCQLPPAPSCFGLPPSPLQASSPEARGNSSPPLQHTNTRSAHTHARTHTHTHTPVDGELLSVCGLAPVHHCGGGSDQVQVVLALQPLLQGGGGGGGGGRRGGSSEERQEEREESEGQEEVEGQEESEGSGWIASRLPQVT